MSIFEPNRVNRFLPLPQFRKPYFVYRDETAVEQGCVVGDYIYGGTSNDLGGSSDFDPWIISPWSNGIGRRAVRLANPTSIPGPGPIAFPTGFWNNQTNMLLGRSGSDSKTGGLVGNVAQPLLADFWTYCDSPDLPAGNG
jgi:hypothetical protein